MLTFYLFLAQLYYLKDTNCPVSPIFITITIFEYHYALIIRYLLFISTQLIVYNLFEEIIYVVRYFSLMLRLFIPKRYLKLIIFGYSGDFFICSNIYMSMKSTIFKLLTYLCIIDFLKPIFTTR